MDTKPTRDAQAEPQHAVLLKSLLPGLAALVGVPVIASEHATEDFRIFPDKKRTKRRLRRLRAKWGSETRRRPAAFATPTAMFVHPTLLEKMKREAR